MSTKYFIQEENHQVRCTLCPHNCRISEGERGICRVRKNEGGTLVAENYGLVSSLALDPIEKKPLYHFFPGSRILSAGTVGCNLRCKFCQNFEISQSGVDEHSGLRQFTPEEMVALALKEHNNIGIAYTYNEPLIWFEYVMDTARLAKESGLKNVMVTNGFASPEPLDELLPLIDAFNVDLKAFTNTFYRHYTSAGLQPVLDTLKKIRNAGRHLEITNLIIPDVNDDEKIFTQMLQWISQNLGRETVLHLSRYFPTYRMVHNSTPPVLLESLMETARKYLDFVYLGNVRNNHGQDTHCPKCGALAVGRSAYSVTFKHLDHQGRCTQCGYQYNKEMLAG